MVAVVIALFVGIFVVTIPALETAVKRQLSLQPFRESQSRSTRSLLDLGQIIVADNAFLTSLRRDWRAVTLAMRAQEPEALRNPTATLNTQLAELRNPPTGFVEGKAYPKSLWDHATRLILRADPVNEEPGLKGFLSKVDLMVVVDLDSKVLFEMNTQSDSEQPEQLGRLPLTIPLTDNMIPAPSALILDLPLVAFALDAMDADSDIIRPFSSYQRYPDGNLYNMVAVPFQDRQYLLLLGERVDMRTAFHAASENTAVLVFVNGQYEDGYRMPWNPDPNWTEPAAAYGTSQTSVPLDAQNSNLTGPGPSTLGPDLVRGAQKGEYPWLPLQGEVKVNYDPGRQEVTLGGESFLTLAFPFLDAPREIEYQDALPIAFPSARPSQAPPPSAARLDEQKFPVLGWLVLLKPTAEIDSNVRAQQMFILSVGLLAALVATLLMGPLSRHITGPILVLARKMRGVVEKGDLSPTEPAGSLEISEATIAFNQMVAGLRQKDVLEKFVPEETRAEVAQEGRLVLGQAQRLTATVMFSDLRGFTSLSERLDPSELVAILGEYLRRMTRVVLENNGSIYEYIGDAILAVFRDKDGVNGAEHAVRAALAMHRELHEYQNSSQHPEVRAMRQGIGLNTGLLVDGNIGMEARAKRAVIGDVVNLAARIQDRSRDGKHTDILVSESTYELTRTKFAFEFFGNEQFKGKSQPEPVWEVLDGPPRQQIKKAPTESGDAVGQRPERRDP